MAICYRTSCTRDNLKKIRRFVGRALNRYHLSDIEINQVVLAVDEICANLIIHSHENNHSDSIEIDVFFETDSITFEIIDFNPVSFDIANYQKPALKSLVKEKRKGGMGLMLVNTIMDSVETIQNQGALKWRLSKKLVLSA